MFSPENTNTNLCAGYEPTRWAQPVSFWPGVWPGRTGASAVASMVDATAPWPVKYRRSEERDTTSKYNLPLAGRGRVRGDGVGIPEAIFLITMLAGVGGPCQAKAAIQVHGFIQRAVHIHSVGILKSIKNDLTEQGFAL